MRVGILSASFFGFFDAPPALGRYFSAAEDSPPNGTAVAGVAYGVWPKRYGGRRGGRGATPPGGPPPHTNICVAPEGFFGFVPGAPPGAPPPHPRYCRR